MRFARTGAAVIPRANLVGVDDVAATGYPLPHRTPPPP